MVKLMRKTDTSPPWCHHGKNKSYPTILNINKLKIMWQCDHIKGICMKKKIQIRLKTEIQKGFPFNHRVSMCERVKEILEN